jgi:Ca-activated chloride channel family protein
MRFESPAWLALLALIPLLVFVFAAGARNGAAGLERFAAKRLLPVLGRSAGWPRILRLVLILATIACLSVAMARPSYGYRLREIHGKGADVIFAIDISRSMLCTDVTPNRLTRAKLAARDMLDIARGHRMGVIPFTREAFLQCPLTLDQEIVAQSIDVLDINNLPKQGTSLAGPIAEARKAFQHSGSNKRILVILSDGEDLEEGGVAEARDTKDMTIITIGTGTVQGAPVPVSATPGSGYLRDESDAPITSRLSPDDLKDVAEATGGFYAPAGSPAIATLFRDAVNRDDRDSNVEAANIRVPIIRYRWPLAAALALLVAEAFIPAFRRKGGAALLALFLFLPIAAPSTADAEEKNPQTFHAKIESEPIKGDGAKQPAVPAPAQTKAAAPKGNPREPYNKGVQAFNDGDYETAYADFKKAASLVSPETPDELKKQIHGNAGASKLAEAIALIPPAEEPMTKEDDSAARKLLDAAKKEIEKALSIAPEDKLLKDNFRLIDAARAELDKHKPKPQVKKPDNKNNKTPDEDEPKPKKPDPLPTPKHKDEPPPPSKGDDKKNDDNKGGGNDNSGGGKDKDNNQNSNSGNGNQQQNGGSGGGSGGGGGGSDQDQSQGAGGGGQNQQGGSGGNNQNQPQGGDQKQPQQPNSGNSNENRKPQENQQPPQNQQGPQNQPRPQQPQPNSPQNQPSGSPKENQGGAQNPSQKPQEQPQQQNQPQQQKPEEKKPQGQDQNQPQQAPQPKQQAGQQGQQPQQQNGSQAPQPQAGQNAPQPQPSAQQGGEKQPQPQSGQEEPKPQPQPQQQAGGAEPQPQAGENAAPQPQPAGNGGQQPGASRGQAPQPQPQQGSQGQGGDDKKQGGGENQQPQPQPVPQPAPQPQPTPGTGEEKKEETQTSQPSGEKKENAPAATGTEGGQSQAPQQAARAAASAAEPRREGDHSASLAPKEASTPEQQETATAAQAGTATGPTAGTAQQVVPAADGKMTSTQAEQLLKILQDDEKLLPAGQAKNQRPDDSSGRDW